MGEVLANAVLSEAKLARIKLHPRFHIKDLEYLIEADVMDDVEQTRVYSDLLWARKSNQTMSLIKRQTPENDSGDGNVMDWTLVSYDYRRKKHKVLGERTIKKVNNNTAQNEKKKNICKRYYS
ncbi:hypothetical protein ACROYT_G027098 [Oculina patagonica]